MRNLVLFLLVFLTSINASIGKSKNKAAFFDDTPLFNTISEIKDQKSALKFELYQNYPNPFNPVTTIGYNLPSRDNVKIIIYSIIGKVIRIIKNEIEDEGYHEINFDGSNLSSGVYIYKIEFGQINPLVQSKKFILQK